MAGEALENGPNTASVNRVFKPWIHKLEEGERNMMPSLTALSHGEWRLGAWDMVLMVGEKRLARKLFKIIRWTYRASEVLSDKVNKGLGSYIEPEVIAAWKSRFKQLVGELRADEKSLLHRFYKSSIWFTNIGLLYTRWAEEA